MLFVRQEDVGQACAPFLEAGLPGLPGRMGQCKRLVSSLVSPALDETEATGSSQGAFQRFLGFLRTPIGP
jgi:hypothetical protein